MKALIVFVLIACVCAEAWTDDRAQKIVDEDTRHNERVVWGRSWNMSASAAQVHESRSVHDKHGHVHVEVVAEDWATVQAIDAVRRDGVSRHPTPGTYSMRYSTALRMATEPKMRLLLTDDSARAVGVHAGMGGGSTADYPTPEAAYGAMRELARLHPTFVQAHVLGKSKEGIEMVAVCMHRKQGPVAVDEPVPTTVWLQQHGKEYIAFKIAVLLAEGFARSAANGDETVNGQLSAIRTCFLPTANPDGIKHFRREVETPDGLVDPNRNFPFTQRLKTAGHQAGVAEHDLEPPISHENILVMSWLRRINAHAVWALHGGARGVFSVPRDSAARWSQRRPFHEAPMRSTDDNTVRAAAGVYTQFSKDFKHNRQFPGGIINGNEWYPAKGALCDWAEEELGVTLCGYIELGPKIPTIDMVMAHYFRENWQAFVRTNAMVLRSFRARVVDDSGTPISARVGVVRFRKSSSSYVHDGASSLFDHDGSMNSKHACAVRGSPHTGFVLKALPPSEEGYSFHVYVGAEGRSARVFTVDVYEKGEAPNEEIVVTL